MALEPVTLTAATVDEVNPEYKDMLRRFWLSVPFAAVLLGLMFFRVDLPWLELALASPVVLWAGWPIFERGWASIIHRSPNMFTLIAAGSGVAYLFSVIATAAPGLRQIGLYFEPAAVIICLVLLGQVLELRARSQTSGAIKVSARLGSQDRARDSSRRRGRRCAARTRASRRRSARAAGRTRSCGWSRHGRRKQRRRIDDHRRADPCRKIRGRSRHRRNYQWHGRFRHASRARRR